MLVVLKPDCSHWSLRAATRYLVVGLDDENYRLVNAQGEPILYAQSLFEVVEPTLPDDWARKEGDGGDWYLDPPALAARGFYERWHDGDPVARAGFERVYAQLLVAQAPA